jgi:hypothetical protein
MCILYKKHGTEQVGSAGNASNLYSEDTRLEF